MDEIPKKLYRSRTDKVLFGVCGGLGHFFNIDPVLIRIVFLLLALAGGSGVILYILTTFITPKEPSGTGKTPESQTEVHTFAKEAGEKMQSLGHELGSEAQTLIRELRKYQHSQWGARRMVGFILIIIGALVFLNRFFPATWRAFWPLLLVIMGLYLIARRNHS